MYEQVINDLGKIYSLGYTPTNAARDNSWRRVQVSIVNRTDLVTRTRPGYYAQRLLRTRNDDVVRGVGFAVRAEGAEGVAVLLAVVFVGTVPGVYTDDA